MKSLSAHPLPLLLQAGIRCTLNADDPLLFGPGLLEEYETARSAFAVLSDHQLAAIARTSIKSSGARPTIVDEAITLIRAWLDTSDHARTPAGQEALRLHR
ncbi:hypothetical protein GCM10022232_89860 [Streptomyces plumbiresistens]|uniref:Adenosine deaminase domain-containing protein n=1 Tax=Streptomyces plumbiresistens TaxID=511811 RepID=A0ABP7TR61_9ACTN